MGKEKSEDMLVSLDEAEEQVRMMARRLAMLYHYMAEVLVEQLGAGKGRETIKEIIRRYGCDSGTIARAKVEALSLPLTAENFKAGSDLPRWGWKGDTVICEDGVRRERITYCPLAVVWKEKKSEELGRLYCLVDEAMFRAYNKSECRHKKIF